MTFELTKESCFPRGLVGVYVGLALVDAIIAVLAFSQLARIQSRMSHGWTRQKVFHLLVGSSNMALVAACNGWPCWSGSCGFIFMAFPEILLLALFLLLFSFWVDLCHQPDDGDDEDEERSFQESLLEKTSSHPSSSNADCHNRCLPLRLLHVGSRQNVVILVIVVIFVLTLAFAVIIWIGRGKNSIDSSVVAQVYVDLVAVLILLLGGALACYGLLLYLKMRKVRSERASSEILKVAGLAVVSVVCFTTSAFVALLTDIPILHQWRPDHMYGVYTSVLLIMYYFIGSSVPSAVILWIMGELPPWIAAASTEERASTITFITGSSAEVHHPQSWTIYKNLTVSRSSPT